MKEEKKPNQTTTNKSTCYYPVTSVNTHTCTAPAPETLQIVPTLPLLAYIVFICWEGKGAEAQAPDEQLAGSYLLVLGGKVGALAEITSS